MSSLSNAVAAEIPTYTLEEEIKARVETHANDLTPRQRYEIIETIRCESGFKQYAFNPKDPEGGSRGLGQFLPSTFARYATILGFHPQDIYDKDQQIIVMSYMFSIGQQKQFVCWRKLFGDLSPTYQKEYAILE